VKFLIIGDTHSNWEILRQIIELEKPSCLLHLGDWGDSEGDDLKFKDFIINSKIPVLSIYGNHDYHNLIRDFKAPNYCFLHTFQPIRFKGRNYLGINGNLAKRIRNPWHITPEIIKEELRLFQFRPRKIDFLLSHEAPSGFADNIGKSRYISGGRESIKEVLFSLKPRFFLCGHLHYPQASQFGNTTIINCGYGVKGDYFIIESPLSYKKKKFRREIG